MTGLRARGGFEVGIEWREGKLVRAGIRASQSKPLKVRYAGKEIELKAVAGRVYELSADLKVAEQALRLSAAGDHETARETNLDLPKECDEIVSKALAGKNSIVMMGCLVFVAFDTGNSFVLDVEDKFACPLCLEGEKQPRRLLDAGTKWAFDWPWRYSVARGHVYFERTDDGTVVPVSMNAGAIERFVARSARMAGTNYRL